MRIYYLRPAIRAKTRIKLLANEMARYCIVVPLLAIALLCIIVEHMAAFLVAWLERKPDAIHRTFGWWRRPADIAQEWANPPRHDPHSIKLTFRVQPVESR